MREWEEEKRGQVLKYKICPLMSLKLTRATGARGLAEPIKSDADATPGVERESAKLSGR